MNKVVTAKKDGKIRKFPLIGLEKMGKDPNGETYDGWEIIKDIEDPAELKEAKSRRDPEKLKSSEPSDESQNRKQRG